MDSRIREIEMRLARAKEGLCEGGREDYLNQLYLLDAEIKAVIKANGLPPQATESKRQQLRRRNLAAPVLQLGMSFGAILLAATVTYAAFQLASAGTSQPTADATVATNPVGGAIQASLPVPVDVENSQPEAQVEPGTSENVSETPPPAVLLADSDSLNNDEPEDPPLPDQIDRALASSQPLVLADSDSLQVVAANYIPPMEDTPTYKAGSSAMPAGTGTVPGGVDAGQLASDQEGFDWTIARFALPGQARKTETEETEVVNSLKEQLSKSASSNE